MREKERRGATEARREERQRSREQEQKNNSSTEGVHFFLLPIGSFKGI